MIIVFHCTVDQIYDIIDKIKPISFWIDDNIVSYFAIWSMAMENNVNRKNNRKAEHGRECKNIVNRKSKESGQKV